jgi:hypothetical protein
LQIFQKDRTPFYAKKHYLSIKTTVFTKRSLTASGTLRTAVRGFIRMRARMFQDAAAFFLSRRLEPYPRALRG